MVNRSRQPLSNYQRSLGPRRSKQPPHRSSIPLLIRPRCQPPRACIHADVHLSRRDVESVLTVLAVAITPGPNLRPIPHPHRKSTLHSPVPMSASPQSFSSVFRILWMCVGCGSRLYPVASCRNLGSVGTVISSTSTSCTPRSPAWSSSPRPVRSISSRWKE